MTVTLCSNNKQRRMIKPIDDLWTTTLAVSQIMNL